MEHSLIIDRFFLPPHENPPEAIHPRVKPFNNPASCTVAASAFGDLFLTTGFDVWSITASAGFTTYCLGVESFVAAKMLTAAGSRTRATNRKTVKRGVEKFLVVNICAFDGQAQRHAPAICQHRPLDTQFTSIRRVFPGFFPRPREPWSSSRRDFATSTGCLGDGRNAASNTSTTGGTRRVLPTLESNCARRCRNRIHPARPSIDSRYAICRKCHRQPSAFPVADDHPREICDI